MKYRSSRGFTLIELLITLAVTAVLLTTALPAFTGSLRKARRVEAVSALMQVQLAQERWRSDHTAYADSPGDIGVKLGAGGKTPGGHYAITIENASAVSYTAVATAQADSSQSGDTACRVLRMTASNGDFMYSSSDAAGHEDKAAATRCWMR